MSASEPEKPFEVVEICTGAGGQSLGLERAGFRHRLAVELDENAAEALKRNLINVLGYEEKEAEDTVKIGDVASSETWRRDEHVGVDLLAGGVPCPPFSVAGKQIGATDERDLFSWAVRVCVEEIKPKALLLENVRGLSGARFFAYRQRILDSLKEYGYEADWRLLQADHYGVSQLRPRFVLVALRPEYWPYFDWPARQEPGPPTVGELLRDLMAEGDWSPEQVDEWVARANDIAPTIVGGSKKHGGADLGPSRAKAAWEALGVDGKGVADEPPGPKNPRVKGAKYPMLTVRMVARIQGWYGEKFADWEFVGGKTAQYRQIGNAFPPPVAFALGCAIRSALRKEKLHIKDESAPILDPIYGLLHRTSGGLTVGEIVDELGRLGIAIQPSEVKRRLDYIEYDFNLEDVGLTPDGERVYKLGDFKGFTGQEDHPRHLLFSQNRTKIS